jgi:hypothetical protein
MKVLIDIPKETYTEVKNKLRGTFLNPKDEHTLIQSFRNGKILGEGKWTNGDPICPCCGEDKFKDLDADIWSDWKPKYCPNCGSFMGE